MWYKYLIGELEWEKISIKQVELPFKKTILPFFHSSIIMEQTRQIHHWFTVAALPQYDLGLNPPCFCNWKLDLLTIVSPKSQIVPKLPLDLRAHGMKNEIGCMVGDVDEKQIAYTRWSVVSLSSPLRTNSSSRTPRSRNPTSNSPTTTTSRLNSTTAESICSTFKANSGTTENELDDRKMELQDDGSR